MNSHYHPDQPGQYPKPQPRLPMPNPPKPKMPLWAKLVVGLFAVPAILVGAVLAIGLGSGIANEAAKTADKVPVPGVQSTYDPGIQTPVVKPTAPATTTQPSPKVTHKPAPPLSVGRQQAIGAAEDYLRVQAFSRAGLIDQLTSQYGEGFALADATYAVDHIDVDWKEQAAKAAREYLAVQHFSRAGLIDQLESEYGGQFTHAQAVYGVTAAGL
jgi:hypothetical protein